MKELLARSLDELPPQTRKLLTLIVQMVNRREGFFFSRKDVREYTQCGHDPEILECSDTGRRKHNCDSRIRPGPSTGEQPPIERPRQIALRRGGDDPKFQMSHSPI